MPPGMLWNVGFLCLTYLPLQVFAIRKSRGSRRILAALPILPMTCLLYGALDTNTYRDGSLYGINFTVLYWPSMLWLLGVLVDHPSKCSQCGGKLPYKSFQIFRTRAPCPHCRARVVITTAEPSHAPEPATGPDSSGKSSPPAR
jgi:DNA-directed RNA polymerase subunit RPC12/RpoP